MNMKNYKRTTSNISAVIRSDIRRLSRSVVTVICVFGLALVPCLYAWFNIMSNWDPYTPDSTQNLKIAVASSDAGTDFVGMKLNVGDIIIDKLKANDQINWQFPDSVQGVMDGLYAGDYYAGLIIPEDFSASILGFTDGEMDQPEIIYYDNQKMNAVASRITDRAQSLVRDEINSIFVSTIVDELSNFTSVFNGMGLSAEDALQSLDTKLGSINSDLKTYAAIMNSMATVTKSAATVTSMTNDLLPDVTDMLINSRKTIVDIQDRLTNSKQDVVYAADAIRNTSEEMRNTVERLDNAVDGDPAEAGGSYIDWDSVFGEGGITDYEGEILDDLYSDVNKQLHESVIAFDDIIQKTNIDKNLVSSMTTLQDSLKNLDTLLAKVEGDIDAQSMTLQQYTDALNSCTVSIESTEDVLNYMVSMVSNLRSSVNELRTSESFTKLIDLLKDDVGGLVEYLASPANLEVVRVYALENFGSGMTPFYTTLALYASALLSVSLMHTHIKRRSDIPTLSTTEAFFGRYFVFFAIGQFTALITVLGNLFYIGIQCYAPFQFWLAAAITSLVFTLLNYGMVFAFGNIGEAIAIIILVIQVAGSGGTYPLEMLPKIFQDLYKFMPFNYAMTAMRETIAGSYGNVYLKSILILLLMAAILIPVSLILGIAFKPLLKHFNESKSKTKLMHSN